MNCSLSRFRCFYCCSGSHPRESIKVQPETAERQNFLRIVKETSDELDNSWNSDGIRTIRNEHPDYRWKYVGIKDVFEKWKHKQNTSGQTITYTTEELEEAQKWFWDEKVVRGKGTNKINNLSSQEGDKANKSSKEYWKKAKELCLIGNSKGKREINASDQSTLICTYQTNLDSSVKELDNKEKEFIEHFGTVFKKNESNSS